MSFPPPLPEPTPFSQPAAPTGDRSGWNGEVLWGGLAAASGVLAGALWWGVFKTRSPQDWGDEGFFAVDGLMLFVVVGLGVAWGVAFLIRPGGVPFRRFAALLVGVGAADGIAWQTGQVLGMHQLTAKVVLLAGPLALATVATLGAAWHASRSS